MKEHLKRKARSNQVRFAATWPSSNPGPGEPVPSVPPDAGSVGSPFRYGVTRTAMPPPDAPGPSKIVCGAVKPYHVPAVPECRVFAIAQQ